MSIYDKYKLFCLKYKSITEDERKIFLFDQIASAEHKTGPLFIYRNNQMYTLYRISTANGVTMEAKKDKDDIEITISVKELALNINFDDELFVNFLMAF